MRKPKISKEPAPKKITVPEETPGMATAAITGSIAGMGAHCARMAVEASELQSRCMVALNRSGSMDELSKTRLTLIFNGTLDLIAILEKIHPICDQLNAIVNNKPMGKDSMSNPTEPDLLG